MSVKRCQREVDSKEFTKWIAYSTVNPFGQIRGDLQAGVIAAQIHNVNRTKETDPVAQPGDYILKFEKPQKKSNTSIAAQCILFTMAAAMNARNK